MNRIDGRLGATHLDLAQVEVQLLDEAAVAQAAEIDGEPLREELWFKWAGRAGTWGPGQAEPGEGLSVRLIAINGRSWRVVRHMAFTRSSEARP